MKLRSVIASLLLFLSLATCADRSTDDCREAWAPKPHASSAFAGLGVNIHFTDPKPGEIKMIADAGFRWVRLDFKWDPTEKERGRYDFSSYDRLLSALDEQKIHALLILDYGNPLYDDGASPRTGMTPPRTEVARQAFAIWAVAAAKHFAGRGILWEVYNEPNINLFWTPHKNVDEYIALALAVGRAFRSGAPGEKLIGPATSEIDFPFLEACFKAGLLDYWSAVSVHPYRHSDPETAVSDYCRLRKLIERYRNASGTEGVIPIISGEWGYSAVWSGMSEEKQGERLAREMLTNLANDIPVSIWYDWRDDGADANEPEHHFGLVRNAYQAGGDLVYQPKPAYLAAKTLSAQFEGYTYKRRVPMGDDGDYVLEFTNGGESRFAAWTTVTGPHNVIIPIKAGTFKVTKHTGEGAGTISANKQGLSIQVSTAPVYISHIAP